MKTSKITPICAALLLLTSCSIDKLDTWTDLSRVWFPSSDTLVVASFKKQPAATSDFTVEIPITMAGKVVNYDREINIEVASDKKNSQTKYEITRPVIIPADSTAGIMKVKVYKTDNLAVEADTVKFAISSSKDLLPGLQKNIKCTLVLINKYTRPWWWYDSSCGTYSEAKHDVLFIVLGSDNDIRGAKSDPNYRRNWSSADALYNLYLLNKYCENQGLSFRFASGK